MTCLRRCEVQRAQIGMLHARRLRGRIARVLTTTGGRRADDTLRRAVLALGSDLAPNPVLLTNAARRATELGDLALTERLARASVAAGGGFEPRLILGNALAWSGRGAEADTEFAVAGSLARNDAERAHAADRVANLAFALGRPSEAEAVFDILLST
ncbi:MAG: helix-turn-helix transcriptional regulator, partial [Pseudonocardiaceae bacterium]